MPAILSLYAAGKVSGVVIDSGECNTSIMPVYDGYPIAHAVQCMNFGGRDISHYLAECAAPHCSPPTGRTPFKRLQPPATSHPSPLSAACSRTKPRARRVLVPAGTCWA